MTRVKVTQLESWGVLVAAIQSLDLGQFQNCPVVLSDDSPRERTIGFTVGGLERFYLHLNAVKADPIVRPKLGSPAARQDQARQFSEEIRERWARL